MCSCARAFIRRFTVVLSVAPHVRCLVFRVRIADSHRGYSGNRWAHRAHDPAAYPSSARELLEPPLIGVLRDIEAARSAEIVRLMYEIGFRTVSVTADTPEFERILDDLCRTGLDGMVIGASSVTDPAQVDTAARCGAGFISSTGFDAAVVGRTKELGLLSIPGVSTASQAVAAVAAGGDILKVFPASQVSPQALKPIVHATSAVSENPPPIIVAGGIEVGDMEGYLHAGASGFAVGSTLFLPGMNACILKLKSEKFMSKGRLLIWGKTTTSR